MKTSIIALAIFILPLSVFGQKTETLFSGGSVKWGGFGGPVVGFTSIGGNLGVLTGGFGGAVMRFDGGHSVHFGGGGFGLANNIKSIALQDSYQQYLTFGYGGFIVGYTNRSYKLIHLTTQAVIGAGHAGDREKSMSPDSDRGGSEFFVFDPSVALEVNITSFFRVSAGVHYRFVSGSSHSTFTDKDLGGVTGMLSFKFGRF